MGDNPSKAGYNRNQMYAFQHKAFPIALFENHPKLLNSLYKPFEISPLTYLWSKADYICFQAGFDTDMDQQPPLRQISRHDSSFGEFDIFIYEMATPQVAPECYYTAVVVDQNEKHIHGERAVKSRYFTLEMSADENGGIFCEWTIEEQHQNYGNTENLSLEFFRELIEIKIEKRISE